MSTSQYHFSTRVNEPRACDNPANCLYGKNTPHYPSPEAYYAEQAEQEGNDTIPSTSREESVDERAERHAGGNPRPVESVDVDERAERHAGGNPRPVESKDL